MKPFNSVVSSALILLWLLSFAVSSGFAGNSADSGKTSGVNNQESEMSSVPPAFVEDEKSKLVRLSLAVSSNDLEVVEALLRQGMSPDADTDGGGLTPLMLAESAEMVKLLLESGADARKTDNRGWNCLHHAATRSGDSRALSSLIRAGADPSLRNTDGDTPVLLARILFIEKIAPEWGKDLLVLLVDSGANIDATDSQGMTLLHYAATSDCVELAKICLELGADPEKMTSYGKSASQLARELKARKVHEQFSEWSGE
jgi:ankyrin repeat protein